MSTHIHVHTWTQAHTGCGSVALIHKHEKLRVCVCSIQDTVAFCQESQIPEIIKAQSVDEGGRNRGHFYDRQSDLS